MVTMPPSVPMTSGLLAGPSRPVSSIAHRHAAGLCAGGHRHLVQVPDQASRRSRAGADPAGTIGQWVTGSEDLEHPVALRCIWIVLGPKLHHQLIACDRDRIG